MTKINEKITYRSDRGADAGEYEQCPPAEPVDDDGRHARGGQLHNANDDRTHGGIDGRARAREDLLRVEQHDVDARKLLEAHGRAREQQRLEVRLYRE